MRLKKWMILCLLFLISCSSKTTNLFLKVGYDDPYTPNFISFTDQKKVYPITNKDEIEECVNALRNIKVGNTVKIEDPTKVEVFKFVLRNGGEIEFVFCDGNLSFNGEYYKVEGYQGLEAAIQMIKE